MTRRSHGEEVLGIALTPASITAAAASIPTVWAGELELHGGGNGSRPALAGALREAARASGAQSPTLVVALLPPLTETRRITLPALGENERNLFLARNASRYFVGARGAQVVGTRDPGGPATKGGAPRPVLATATAQQLMHAVQGAAEDSGCTLRGIVPAESAWAAAATAIWPALSRGTAFVAVTRDDRTDLLTVADGALESVRRFRGPADAAEIVALAAGGGGTGAARVAILGPAAAAQALAEALAASGARVLRPDSPWLELADRPEALAARFAASATGLQIRSEESRAAQLANVRRLAWWTLAAAAALLVIAPFVHYLGVKRELASIQAARAAIRSQVEASLVGRSSVDVTYRQVAGLAGAARDAQRWSTVLATLAAYLPRDASLTSVHTRGDSLFVDGVADRASPVFDALGRMPGIAGVKATAPVRREAIEGEAPLEHFSLGAELTRGKR